MKTKYHETAGGIVFNDAGQFLVIVRDIEREGAMRHEVRLPKGHIDPGETHEQAATREVCEESGYCHVEIVADLGTMHSEFEFNDRHNVRDEHYYLMRLTRDECRPPAPTNDEEALFQPEWLDPYHAFEQMTYPSERGFVERAIHHLNDHGKDAT